MIHGSLFSGIGGFDLASEWMGWENAFHCEINPFGQKILKYYWPNAISYDDITKTDFTIHRGTIDVLTGGFPCQPYSFAGKRLGKEDARHLWPEYHRAIKEIKPAWVVGENVPGLINWSKGLVFEEVQADLENEGYEVWPFILPACGVGAPHRRERIWFIAYSKSYGNRRGLHEMEGSDGSLRQSKKCRENNYKFGNNGKEWDAPNSNELNDNLSGLRTGEVSQFEEAGIRENITSNSDSERGCCRNCERQNAIHVNPCSKINGHGNDFEGWPNEPPVCRNNDGFSIDLDRITFSKWRNESIKGYGNAVVPQVAYQIFKAIEQYESTN